MKRGYTALEFKKKIRKLRAVRPTISISSDFIVGFPGETDADFEKTMKLIDDVGFDQSFSFIYSKRPGTPASNLANDTTDAVKHERLARLQTTINANARRIGEAMVGSVQRVLVEGPSKTDVSVWSGRTRHNKLLHFVPTAGTVAGDLVSARVTSAAPHWLRGEMLARVRPARRRRVRIPVVAV